MEIIGSAPERPRNRILSSLGDGEYGRLLPDLELVGLEIREIIYDIGAPIEHVYFVESGVLSIMAVMPDGSALEAATVGLEGMLGIPVFLETDRSATQAFCQVPGRSIRTRSGMLRRLTNGNGSMRALLNRYTQALFTQVAQSSACNRLHSVRQRCARWLLQTHDRVEGDEFPLTHDFLSQMLGVRRATVTEVAGILQREGLVTYDYGRMAINDRAGLEAVSCECYAIVKSEFDRLLEGRRTPSPLDRVVASRDGKSTLNNGTPRQDPNSPDD